MRLRARRRLLRGIVTGDKMDKTRRVEVERYTRHAKYGKIIRRRTVCYVHDENNISRTGDVLLIMETRPLSKTKRRRLVQLIAESTRDAPIKKTRGVAGTSPPTAE